LHFGAENGSDFSLPLPSSPPKSQVETLPSDPAADHFSHEVDHSMLQEVFGFDQEDEGMARKLLKVLFSLISSQCCTNFFLHVAVSG
jgi:hypothetical protein